jgi:hypothetical protein
MDVLTSLELAATIIHENNRPSKTQATLALGYTIDVIFASYSKSFKSLSPNKLVVLWKSLPQNICKDLPQLSYSSDDFKFQLYNPHEKRWNWPFVADGSGGGTPESSADAPLGTTPTPSSELTTEHRVAQFYNAISAAAKESCTGSGPSEGIHRHWMAEWSWNPLPGSQYSCKPDLVLVDQATTTVDEVTWLSPKVVGEYTRETDQPAGRLGKTMDTKAYIMFIAQPWRRYVLRLSIASNASTSMIALAVPSLPHSISTNTLIIFSMSSALYPLASVAASALIPQ